MFNANIDLLIAGHIHVCLTSSVLGNDTFQAYERIWPVEHGAVLAQDYLNMNTTLHICTGSPGNEEIDISPWSAAFIAHVVGSSDCDAGTRQSRPGARSGAIRDCHQRGNLKCVLAATTR